MNTIWKRRSVRTFLKKPVEEEKLKRIIGAGMQAPSSRNGQTWEFICVTEPDLIAGMKEMSPYAGLIEKAPSVIVVCNNEEEAKKKKEEDWWIQGLSACVENILLQVVEEGLGAVWMGVYPRQKRIEFLRNYFQMPDNLFPFAVIPIGYAEHTPEPENRFDESKIHYNGFEIK